MRPIRPPGGASGRAVLAAAVAVALLALVAGVLVARGGSDGPPDTLARLVPADALAYAHLTRRPRDAAFARAAAALPPARRLRDALGAAVAPGGTFSYERDVRPWLGEEVAYAVLPGEEPLLLARVADRRRAEALVARLGDLERAPRRRDVPVLAGATTTVAFLGDVLAAGSEPAVRAAVDRHAGAGAALADVPAYARALAGRPGERSLDVYASPAGARTVLGALGALVDRPGLAAVGGSVTAEDGGLRARLRIAGGAPRDAGFTPVLVERVPEGAAAYLGLRGAARLARLVERTGGAGALEDLRRLLRREAGVELERDLLAPLAGELALSVTGPQDDPEASSAGAPVLTLKAGTSEPERTGAALARLQEPLAARLALPGTAPGFRAAVIGGAEAQVLRVTPELAPSYAVADGAVALSTAPAGLAPPRGTVAGSEGFRATIGDVPEKVDSLVFLDLRQLLALGEQTGLTAIPGLGTTRDDLARVRSAGAVVTEDTAHPSDTTAELFLEIP